MLFLFLNVVRQLSPLPNLKYKFVFIHCILARILLMFLKDEVI